ncbi:DegT/DnrJ/EryC1/StrS family aminotransferase [Flavobacteriaceae bacterium]|nr:DegT/DnrJ/EryC1/StrS family aminotransferase [Flavobacteriaceae bacterium]
MINVTQTFFPPIEDYQNQILRIWKNKWLTNNGELSKELTASIKSYLGVDFIIPMTNGTLPLQIALNALANEGEVITTPFSYVATTSVLVWEKCTPVFVDIHPEYLTIDETKIEAAISDKTTAILATHVYGNPCNVDAIETIAKKHKLKVIYDAAHCFGINYNGQSIFNYGDVSTCSFHATKIFHTGEGGALFCKDKYIFNEMHYRHNFGHKNTLDFHGVGINAKISELQAAMGLSVLPFMEHIVKERKNVCDYYDKYLDFSKISKFKLREGTDWNYSYYPIIFEDEETLLRVQKKLNIKNIFPRRYFYPSLNKLNYVLESHMPISESISSRIMCLPLYVNLCLNDVNQICRIISS